MSGHPSAPSSDPGTGVPGADRAPARPARSRQLRVPAYCALLAALVLGPLLGPGYLLLRDAVSTPRSYLTDTALGLGAAAPRAVPQDAALAVLSPIIDGGVLVKAVLFVALWAAGFGAAVLAKHVLAAGVPAQLVAATVAVWNPYVAERLLQGHWSLLAGYAALPWTVVAADRLRRARPGPGRSGTFPAWAALAACFAAAGLTPTGALLAGLTGFALVGLRRLPLAAALWLAASAPWLAATLATGSGAEPSDPAGVAAFAARAEPWLGTLGSLAGLGGIWNGEAVPASRTTGLAFVATLLLLAIVAVGAGRVGRAGRTGRTLLVLAAASIVLPALGATPWGLAAGEWLVVHVPGAGLLRDTQKYVALAVPAYALCAAAACARLAALHPARGPRAETAGGPAFDRPDRPEGPATGVAATALILLLVLPLADLAWGVAGALRPVHYPAGWAQVVERVDGPGDVAVLPGGMFRRFPYSGDAPVLDPAPRILPADVLQTGELPVHGRTVAGEAGRAGLVEALLLRGGTARELADLGVGWVLVERTTPGPLGASRDTLAGLVPVYADRDLALYAVPDPRPADPATATQRAIAVAAHGLWALLLIGGLFGAAAGAPRRASVPAGKRGSP